MTSNSSTCGIQERFDFLVSDGQTVLEVECKTKSVDAGRKITRPNFYLLCDVLAAELAPLTESVAVLFKCDGRLSGDQELFHSVADKIKACKVSPRVGQVSTLHFEARYSPAGLQIRTEEEERVLSARISCPRLIIWC